MKTKDGSSYDTSTAKGKASYLSDNYNKLSDQINEINNAIIDLHLQ